MVSARMKLIASRATARLGLRATCVTLISINDCVDVNCNGQCQDEVDGFSAGGPLPLYIISTLESVLLLVLQCTGLLASSPGPLYFLF